MLDQATAEATLLQGHASIHKDDLHEVDDCLQVARIGAQHVHLTPDASACDPHVTNGYFPLPKSAIDRWIARRANG